MAIEQSLGVAPDGTGKRVRNLEVTIMQGDGTTATVEMQVVSIADRRGNVINFEGLQGELERLNDNIEELLFQMRLQTETDED